MRLTVGSDVKNMLVVYDGVVSLFDDNGQLIEKLSEGRVLGEAALLGANAVTCKFEAGQSPVPATARSSPGIDTVIRPPQPAIPQALTLDTWPLTGLCIPTLTLDTRPCDGLEAADVVSLSGGSS